MVDGHQLGQQKAPTATLPVSRLTQAASISLATGQNMPPGLDEAHCHDLHVARDGRFPGF